MASEAQEWAFRWFRNIPMKSLLVLCGNSGCGKSHVASRLTHYARAASFIAYERGNWQDGPPSVFSIRWTEAVASMNEKRDEFWVQDAMDASWLFIDDIGAENDPWKKATDRLCQILSRRERKFSVVTTNTASANWPDRFDIRVADRLFRNSVIVDMTGVPSYSMK